MKEKSIHWGRIILIALSVFLILGAGVYATVQEVDLHQETSGHAADNAASQIEQLYLESGSTFLKKDIKGEEVTAARLAVDELNDRNTDKPRVEAMIEDVEERFEALTFLNEHFETADDKAPINGDEIAEEVVIVDEVKAEDLKQFKNNFGNQIGEENDNFYQAVKNIVDEGTTQLKTKNDIQAKLKQLEANDELTYEELDERIQELMNRVSDLDNTLFAKKMENFILDSYSALTEQVAGRLEEEARSASGPDEQVKEAEAAAEAQRRKVQQEQQRLNESSGQEQSEEQGQQAPAGEAQTPAQPQQPQAPQQQPTNPSAPAPRHTPQPAPQPNPEPQPQPQQPQAPQQPQPQPQPQAEPEPEVPAPQPAQPIPDRPVSLPDPPEDEGENSGVGDSGQNGMFNRDNE